MLSSCSALNLVSGLGRRGEEGRQGGTGGEERGVDMCTHVRFGSGSRLGLLGSLLGYGARRNSTSSSRQSRAIYMVQSSRGAHHA